MSMRSVCVPGTSPSTVQLAVPCSPPRWSRPVSFRTGSFWLARTGGVVAAYAEDVASRKLQRR
jgi:hypothetical protein